MSEARALTNVCGNSVATLVVAMILVAATLESAFAICLGCWIFGHLMRLGVIPDDTCAACADVSSRLGTA